MKPYDIVIVGGGIIGMTIAILLKIRYTSISIAIVEQNLLGSGSTFYSAGFSAPLTKNNQSKEIFQKINSIISEISKHIDLDLKVLDTTYIGGEQYLKEHYVGSNCLKKQSILSLLNHPLYKYFSLSNVQNETIYLSKKESHYANPAMLCKKYGHYIQAHNGSIFEKTKVSTIFSDSNRALLKLTNGEQLLGKQVVLATGAWTPPPIDNVTPKHQTKKIVALHMNIKFEEEKSSAIVFPNEKTFLLPLFHKNYWLFSLTSTEWNVNPANSISLSSTDKQLATCFLDKYLPNLKSKIIGARAFCDNYSNSGTIRIKKMSENVFYISGASGSGYRFSYNTADEVIRTLKL